MIVYVLEFKGTRIEFRTEDEALRYKKANGIKANVIEVEKIIEPEINTAQIKWDIEQQAEILFDSALESEGYSRFDLQIFALKGEPQAIALIDYYESLWSTIQINFKRDNYDFKLPQYVTA